MKKQCPEETWEGSEEYCIFHDPSPEKDAGLFRQKLEKKLEKKDLNFRGYCFPEFIDFEDTEFEGLAGFRGANFRKGADFNGANFRKGADFNGANFREGADFSRTTFQEYAGFGGAIFQEYANLWRATFQEYADFCEATFQYVDFREVTFQEYADFGGAIFQEYADFSRATFQKNADFNGATFQEDVDFKKAIFQEYVDFKKAIFQEYVDFWRATFHYVDFRELEIIYRNLKQKMQRDGDYSQAGNFYYQEMEMRRRGSDSRKERIWLGLYNFLAGYGEKPVRTAISALVTVLIFAFVYWALGCLDYAAENVGHLEELIYSLYFSFVTFTTLGIGDIEPLTHTGRILICCEAVIGAFLIALFVVVFARKMMR